MRQVYVLQTSAAPDNQALEAIRKQLFTCLAPRWRNLQGNHPFNLYVHLAPSADFLLRVHQPERYADQPAAQRPLLLDALRDASSKVGMGMDYDGLGMRAIAPLQLKSSSGMLSIGPLEVGLDVLSNLQQLDHQLDAEVALLLPRSEPRLPNNGEDLPSPAESTRHWYLEGSSRT